MAHFIHLPGQTPYADAHTLQRRLVDQRARGEIDDTVLLLEHTETITLGRARGAASNVLDAGDVPVVSIERGGDATWHGPGQLVAYPIIALMGPWADLHRYLRAIEQSVIDLLADLGLSAQRDPRNTGVWLPDSEGPPRKVCSVGIACRRWVTWHGLALNVDPDRTRFATIRPCGFPADVMTKLSEHLSPCPALTELVSPLARHLARRLEIPHTEVVRRDVTEFASALGAPWSVR